MLFRPSKTQTRVFKLCRTIIYWLPLHWCNPFVHYFITRLLRACVAWTKRCFDLISFQLRIVHILYLLLWLLLFEMNVHTIQPSSSLFVHPSTRGHRYNVFIHTVYLCVHRFPLTNVQPAAHLTSSPSPFFRNVLESHTSQPYLQSVTQSVMQAMSGSSQRVSQSVSESVSQYVSQSDS